MLAGSGLPQKEPYDFTQEQNVFSSDQEYATYYISVDFVDEDALNRILQD